MRESTVARDQIHHGRYSRVNYVFRIDRVRNRHSESSERSRQTRTGPISSRMFQEEMSHRIRRAYFGWDDGTSEHRRSRDRRVRTRRCEKSHHSIRECFPMCDTPLAVRSLETRGCLVVRGHSRQTPTQTSRCLSRHVRSWTSRDLVFAAN